MTLEKGEGKKRFQKKRKNLLRKRAVFGIQLFGILVVEKFDGLSPFFVNHTNFIICLHIGFFSDIVSDLWFVISLSLCRVCGSKIALIFCKVLIPHLQILHFAR